MISLEMLRETSLAGNVGRGTANPQSYKLVVEVSTGALRGNHEVMVRRALANIGLRNQLAPGTEGGWTEHQPTGERMFIYDALGAPLMILAGKEYGSDSSPVHSGRLAEPWIGVW